MRFKIGNFSICCSNLTLFALADYQSPIDRYRNGKPILRLHGPIAKGTIAIDEINDDFIANPKQRKTIASEFNTTAGQTKKAVRVRMPNGKTHIRIQTVRGGNGAIIALTALSLLATAGVVSSLARDKLSPKLTANRNNNRK